VSPFLSQALSLIDSQVVPVKDENDALTQGISKAEFASAVERNKEREIAKAKKIDVRQMF
jgi:hypothetical protein